MSKKSSSSSKSLNIPNLMEEENNFACCLHRKDLFGISKRSKKSSSSSKSLNILNLMEEENNFACCLHHKDLFD